MNIYNDNIKSAAQILQENSSRLLDIPAEIEGIQTDHYDSKVERDFMWEIRKHLKEGVIALTQLPAPTTWNRFRIDCGLLSPSGEAVVGIEIDGKEFHDYTTDLDRDSKILRAGVVPKIYRIRARDIVFRLNDTLQLLSLLEPNLFSRRGHINLEALACRINERRDQKLNDGFIRHYLPLEENFDADTDYQPTFIVRRTARSFELAA